MSKGLEALEEIKQTIRLKNDGYINLFETLDFSTIEKELKALEIIRKKISPLAKYTFYPLTQEEYELLKEVLCESNNDKH